MALTSALTMLYSSFKTVCMRRGSKVKHTVELYHIHVLKQTPVTKS